MWGSAVEPRLERASRGLERGNGVPLPRQRGRRRTRSVAVRSESRKRPSENRFEPSDSRTERSEYQIEPSETRSQRSESPIERSESRIARSELRRKRVSSESDDVNLRSSARTRGRCRVQAGSRRRRIRRSVVHRRPRRVDPGPCRCTTENRISFRVSADCGCVSLQSGRRALVTRAPTYMTALRSRFTTQVSSFKDVRAIVSASA